MGLDTAEEGERLAVGLGCLTRGLGFDPPTICTHNLTEGNFELVPCMYLKSTAARF